MLLCFFAMYEAACLCSSAIRNSIEAMYVDSDANVALMVSIARSDSVIRKSLAEFASGGANLTTYGAGVSGQARPDLIQTWQLTSPS